jgi:hypothetical protein
MWGTSSHKWERVRSIYTHHPKTSCWLLSPGVSKKTPGYSGIPKKLLGSKVLDILDIFPESLESLESPENFPKSPKLHWTAQVSSEKKP